MSKGSNRRPALIDQDKFNQNWDTIFNKGKADAKEEAQALQEVARQQQQHREQEAAQ